MNTEEKIKIILLKNTNAFFLDAEERKACINGRTNRTELIKEKLTPTVKKIIKTVKEDDDI